MHVIGVKNDHFYSLPAKKTPKKFGNFSTTDIFPALVARQMYSMHSVKRVRILKINQLKK